jgi:hypothetical protein
LHYDVGKGKAVQISGWKLLLRKSEVEFFACKETADLKCTVVLGEDVYGMSQLIARVLGLCNPAPVAS